MRSLLLTALVLLVGLGSAAAQRFGYVDTQTLLAELDEMKAAESDLVSFRDQQQKLLQTKIEAFQAELADLERRNSEGLLTPKQIQEAQADMQQKQTEIGEFELQVSEQLAERRAQKLQPIFDRVNAVIAEVAEEGEFTYVFNGGEGGLILYADASMDLTDAVRARLASGGAAPATSAPSTTVPEEEAENN